MIWIVLPILLLIFYNFYWKRRNLPPGPIPLPIIGNFGSLPGIRPRYDVFLNWQKKYGSVFTFWLSELPLVLVCDYKLLHDAFVRDYPEELAGKYAFKPLMKRIRGGMYGIVEVSGDLWREQRRFSLQVLRNFGFGRNLMEQKILDEVGSLLKDLEEDQEKGVCEIMSQLDLTVGSVINNLIFGYRFEGSQKSEFKKIKGMITELFVHINTPLNLIVGFLDFLRYVPPFRGAAEKSAKLCQNIFDYLDEQIEKHQKVVDLTSDSEANDFCEAYLKEIHRQEEINGIHKKHYSQAQLRNICMDLWLAGLETTSTTCQFAIVYLLNHPNVYSKMQKELDSVVSGDRLVNLNDKNNLPYFQAVINEVQRMTNLLLIGLFHETLDDVIIGGYKIPKGTAIAPQISNVLFDEKIFPEPFKFDPERFLDSSGNLKKVDEMVPFSLGKRQCLGESLAKMELFLILSNLFKHFEVYPEKEGIPPSMEKRLGIVVQPEPFKIRVEKRKL